MATNGGSSAHSSVDDLTAKITSEIQLKKYGKFLEEYASQLRQIEEALGDKASDSWDITLRPIRLMFSPFEQVALSELIICENPILNKSLHVLCSLCLEIDYLVSEARQKFYGGLLFYSEGESPNALQSGTAQITIGRMMPFLQDLLDFVLRCYDVTKNVVQQLASLHHSIKGVKRIIDVPDLHLQPVYEHLGKLLTCLVTLDEIVANHVTLKEHWSQYKRMLKVVRPNPARFRIRNEDVGQLDGIVHKLGDDLLDGRIFQGCVEQIFDDGRAFVSKNSTLQEEFSFNIKFCFAQLDARLTDFDEDRHRSKLVDIISLFVLHFYIFQVTDKKLFKLLWDSHKKVPAVTLIGNILWFPDSFLMSQLPHGVKTVDKKAQASAVSSRHAYLTNRGQAVQRELQNLHLQVSSWMVKMETVSDEEPSLSDEFNKRCILFTQGVRLASAISETVRLVMNLHLVLSKPMTKTAVLSMCRMVEMLKAIEYSYQQHTMLIAECLNHLVQHLTFMGLNLLSSAKKHLLSSTKQLEQRKLVYSALTVMENALNGTGTKERRLVVRIAACVGTLMKSFRDEDLATFNALLNKLDTICDLSERLQEASDCSFLYWHRVVLPIYFNDLNDHPLEVRRVQYIFGALRDCVPAMLTSCHCESRQALLDTFENEINDIFKQSVLDPLCRDVENDLRLQTHSHLQLDDRNPFRTKVKDLSPFLCLRPIRFFDKMINVKVYVEHYLEKTYYNATTVALHDWKTYGEMRALARHKYKLFTVDDYLPSQTLEQGLDVLEIMRNIHIFVSKYLYNLYNQIFIEKTSNNKHLNTISIRHIANSIRTHGIGIMNTTVNFTYQFLRKKFSIFSQFLYDEHIKSRLIKDLRYFHECKAQNNDKYPFDRAEKFNRGIRKLGVVRDNLSYLDLFRLLISEIGNALGYVRMIRSGGLHCCHNAIRFIPDLDDIVTFRGLCEEENLSGECRSAAGQLDDVISNLASNFAEGTEYFKLLVDVFSSVFRDPKNMHLRNFYIIVPPLTINFVEHIVRGKENMNRKNKTGAFFTDDGFAMGLAYILKLLDQYHEFDSLHWFESIQEKYKKDRAEVTRQQKDSATKEDQKLQQTITLTLKRLEVFRQEFQLLYFTLSSARIFFQADSTVCKDAVSVDDASSASPGKSLVNGSGDKPT